MNPEPELVAHLRRLEEDLLRPEVRRSRAALEDLLAPDFTEVGASGRTWDRATIVAALADEEPATVRVEDFAVRLSGPTLRSRRIAPCASTPQDAVPRSPSARRSGAVRTTARGA